MSTEQMLMQRSNSSCELCTSTEALSAYAVAPDGGSSADTSILLCQNCLSEIEKPNNINHWRCLNESMWSQIPAVQVIVWRQLNRLSSEPWAQDLLDMLYLEEDVMIWAQATVNLDSEDTPATLDSNGTKLEAGDTVTLIKDLDVKGAGFTAKRGTAVRGISLTENPTQIEGRVNGVRIVLLTQYLKKSN